MPAALHDSSIVRRDDFDRFLPTTSEMTPASNSNHLQLSHSSHAKRANMWITAVANFCSMMKGECLKKLCGFASSGRKASNPTNICVTLCWIVQSSYPRSHATTTK